MTDQTLRNLGFYALIALVNMVAIATAAGLGAGTVPLFRDGEFMAPARGDLAALLAVGLPLLSTWLAANRPKYGHEAIASLADEVGHVTARAALRDAAVAQAAGVGMAPFTDDQIAQLVVALHAPVAADLEQRMKAAPAEPGSVV